MWETARVKLRDWYIVVIALLLIGGGFFLASHQSSSTAPATAVHSANPSPAPETAAPPQHQHQMAAAAPAATSTAAPNPASAAPAAPAKAPPPVAQPSSSDDHAAMHKMAAAEPQAQALTPGGAAAAPPAGGDPAAGRLVFRKCQACHSMEPGKTLLRSFARRHPRPQSGRRRELQLFTGDEAGERRLGCEIARRLSRRSAEGRARQQDALPGAQDRAGSRRRYCVLRRRGRRRSSSSGAPGNAPAPAREAPLAQPSGTATATQSSTAAGAQCRRHLCAGRQATPCAPASPKAAWSISGSAARSTARSIRS